MMRRGAPWAAALLAVVAAWIGTRAYLHHAAVQRGVPTSAGEASAPNPSKLAAPPEAALAQIPERLPGFTLEDLAGKPTAIGAWAGRSLVINFWATWCAPCRREIPLLAALYTEWTGRDVAVIGIAVDHRDQVAAFAERFKIPYPLLIGDQDALDVAVKLGVTSPVFPFTVFTDRHGRIVALYLGELHKAQADLILGVVQQLNQDQLPLAEARRSITEGLNALQAKIPG